LLAAAAAERVHTNDKIMTVPLTVYITKGREKKLKLQQAILRVARAQMILLHIIA
jgi:hypothetical protein